MQVNARGGVQPVGSLHRASRPARRGAATPSIRTCACGSERARNITAADYIEMVNERARLDPGHGCAAGRSRCAWRCRPRRSWRPPWTKSRRPTISARKNAMLLRNTSIVEFLRSLRDFAAAAARRWPADRIDAGRAQRPRPPPVPHRGGGRAVASLELPQRLQQHPIALDADLFLERRFVLRGQRFGLRQKGPAVAGEPQRVPAPVGGGGQALR